MIDIHCHILPDIDDGPKSVDDSLAQLRSMAEGGITDAFLTSHYFRGHYHYSKEEYLSKFHTFAQEASHQQIQINLHPGFEIFLLPGIEDDVQSMGLTMGDSSYVLVETELNGKPMDVYGMMYQLLCKGFKPILAHVERYVGVMTNPREAYNLMTQDVYMQVNAGSLLGYYGIKVESTAWYLVDQGWAHFIASDDHVRSAYEHMFASSVIIADNIDKYTADLLFNKHPRHVLDNKRLPKHYVQIENNRSSSSRNRRKKGWFSRLFG